MFPIVAIGASQGGVQALQAVVAGLGHDFPAPVLIVLHIGASPSLLPTILTASDGLLAGFGGDGEKIRPGRIYVAPPDHHLLVTDGVLELSHGPRENWARPAVDPLFRSVAFHYGPGAIGIVLTGQLNDGTAGLYEIKRQGGIAIVQTPSSAEAPSMPGSALENVAVDYCMPVAEMPRLLKRLVTEANNSRSPYRRGSAVMEKKDANKPSALICPECGGAMREETTGPITQFQCHIGHVMTAEILASAQAEMLETALSSARRLLNERIALCRTTAEKQLAKGNTQAGELWLRAAEEAEKRADLVQPLVDQNWTHPEAGQA